MDIIEFIEAYIGAIILLAITHLIFKLIKFVKICDIANNAEKTYTQLEQLNYKLEQMINAHAYEISQIEEIIKRTEIIEKSLSEVDSKDYIIK